MPRPDHINDLEDLRMQLSAEHTHFTKTLTFCGGTGCQASGSLSVIDAVKDVLSKEGLDKRVLVRVTGCHGFCEQGPIMVLEPGNIFYCHLTPDDAHDIVIKTVSKGEVIERLLYTDPVSGTKVGTEAEIPFYRAQDRQLLSQNRLIDPCSIESYIVLGGYRSLTKALTEMPPVAIIEEIKASGLRGRGGGGFPTGRKWADCWAAPGDEKYVICNADEGDPGAYMDRCLLEGNPHLVFEGMMIGALAIGARQGYVYVRKEYPLAVKHARVAVQQARELGLLGEHILGSTFSFDIEIARGGGAFVCGESTALMASLEGKVGEPRPKDVHTVVDGLWHKALTGRVKNTGLVEVAMGTPLRTVVFDIGGGADNGRAVKAVQTGGPSGGCLPVDKFDLPIDFEALAEAGSMVGSGGMVVMDEGTCMVDVAKYFLAFLQDESCGKCVPCRLGIDRMLEIISDITEGHGRPEQITLLEDLAETVGETSLCALGKSARNPVLSTLRYFRDEYEAHINQKRCPAGVCKAMVEYAIDPEKCNGCGVCRRACPHGAISGKKKQVHVIDPETCRKCGICQSECKFEAVVIK